MVDSTVVVDHFHNRLEEQFSHMADGSESDNRKRALREILEKVISLQQQLSQQEERYFVNWISPGTLFQPESMQTKSEEAFHGSSRVVQYCHQPLLEKYAKDGSGIVVIARAVVLCE